MLNFYSNNIRFINIITDIILLNICFIISIIFGVQPYVKLALLSTLIFFCFLNFSWIVLFSIQGTYKIYRVTKIKQILKGIFLQITFHFILLEALIGTTGLFNDLQGAIISSYLLLLFCIPLFRIIAIKLLKNYRLRGNNLRSVVIAGADSTANNLSQFFKENPEFGYDLKSLFSDKNDNLPNLKQLAPYVINHNIDEIYCSLTELSESETAYLIEFANKHLLRIKLLPDNKGYNKRKFKEDYYGKIPVLIPKVLLLEDISNVLSKRIFDIVFSSLVIVTILSWLIPILAILIRLDSKGSIIFKQRRSGFNNRDFYCFKLRTMYSDQSSIGFKQATKQDSRITKIGAFLRKTSLDELPQFFNVLSGKMSIIGPRPHPVEMTKQYTPSVERYMLRHMAKPGISGISQVFGYRGETKELYQMRNRVKMDIFYIENWSLLLDMKIVVWTIKSILKGQEEAY